MSGTQQLHRRPGGLVVNVDSTPTACLCGQDLDVHAGRFCPRCGLNLSFPHAA